MDWIAHAERLLAIGLLRPEYVIDNGIGEHWQPATFSGAWKEVPDTVAMRTMGHADTRILARYQDVVSELQRDAAARMDPH